MITATLQNLSADPETQRRLEIWRAVLGTNTVPILSSVPIPAVLPGIGHQLVYRMDVKALTPKQRQRLVVEMSVRFHETPEQVERDLDDPDHGVPVLASDVHVMLTGEHAALLVP